MSKMTASEMLASATPHRTSETLTEVTNSTPDQVRSELFSTFGSAAGPLIPIW
jgi:hypothetical protein